jgi:WD40 repeat protein
LLAASQKAGELKLWDIPTGKEVFSIRPTIRLGNGANFRFSPDGQFLLTEEHGGELRRVGPLLEVDYVQLWDIPTNQLLGSIAANFHAAEFTPGSASLITWQRGEYSKIIAVQQWRIGKNPPSLTLIRRHEISAHTLTVSPDGKALATVNFAGHPDCPDEVELWDLETGTARLRFEPGSPRSQFLRPLFSPDGRMLAIFTGFGPELSPVVGTRLWDVSGETASELERFSTPVLFSSDGKWITVRTTNGLELHEIGSPRAPLLLHPTSVDRLLPLKSLDQAIRPATTEFSPDNRWVAAAELSEYKELSPFLAWFSRYVCNLQTPPETDLAKVWDVKTGREHARFKKCRKVLLSPDGTTLAVLPLAGGVELWEVPVRPPAPKVVGLSFLAWLASWTCWLSLARWWWKRKARRAA